MFSLLLNKRSLFVTITLLVIYAIVFFLYYDLNLYNYHHWIIILINFLSVIINLIVIHKTKVLKNNNLGTFIFILLFFTYSPLLLQWESALAFLFLSVAYFLLFYYYQIKNNFFLIGCLFTISCLLDYYIFPLIITPLFLSFYRFQVKRTLVLEFFLGIFVVTITMLQLLYVFDKTVLINNYFCSIHFQFPSFNYKLLWLIPLSILSIISFSYYTLYYYNKESIYRRQTNRLYFLLFIFSIIPSIIFVKDSTTLLYFINLPLTIILCRYIQYLYKKWIIEFMIWIIVISSLGFIFYNDLIDFYNF